MPASVAPRECPTGAHSAHCTIRVIHDGRVRRPLRYALAWAIVLGSIGAVVWAWNQWVVPVSATSASSSTPRQTSTTQPTGAPSAPPGAFPATVQWVSDGDTIGAQTADRKDIHVRLIGINTPETKKPNTPVECYGPEASSRLTQLLPRGTRITAAYQDFRIDKYQRDLWDIWLADGTYVQGLMVSGGFARLQTFGGTDRDARYLAGLEATARVGRIGLWGACPNP